MDIVLILPSALASKQGLARAIKKSGRVRVASEGAWIVCKTNDPIKIASRLADLPEIDNIVLAKKISSRFSKVVEAIVQQGSRAILPKERFYVKVIQTTKADYVDRDVEFASTGALVGKLAEINALPAKSEQDADRVIVAIIGKRSAYVCVKGKT